MKQVKFNLYVDQQKIRTIEELKEHFNIDDLLEWYEQGILQKWLSVRHYNEELEKVESIQSKDLLQIAVDIMKIFKFSEEHSKIAIDALNYRLNYAKNHKEMSDDSHVSFDKYFNRYDEIKEILLKGVK